jgi:dipeptidyl aminopeptidase/acylaminoacyl peptidase
LTGQKVFDVTDGGRRRLYRAGVTENRTIAALSLGDQDVEQFDFADGTIIYSVATSDPQYEAGARAKERSTAGVASEVVTGRSLEELIFPEPTEKWLISSWREVWVIRQNGAHRLVDTTSGRAIRHPGGFNYAVLALSPDGLRVITVAPVAEKSGRTSYGDVGQSEGAEFDAYSVTTPYQYVVVDLATGRSTPLIDAPLGLFKGYTGVTDVVWSPDRREVLATGTFLPRELERHEIPWALAIITPSVAGGDATCLMRESSPTDHSPRYILEHSAAFGPSSRQVTARTVGHRGDVPQEVWYEAWRNKWREVHAWSAPIHRDGISLVIRQGLSDPPAVYARATAHDRWIKIWDPNPQLEARSLGDVSVLRWTDATGYEWSAGLVKPPDFAVGKRYPLVIQTHTFNMARFLTDGGYSTAFAARPLASGGMLVLQMDLRDTHIGTPQEIPDQLAGFFSALDVLTSQGLIEPSRVVLWGSAARVFMWRPR